MEEKMKVTTRLKKSLLGRLFLTRPLGAIGFVILMFFVFVAVFADIIAPEPMVNGMMQYNVIGKLAAPSLEHWLGTDSLGIDVLSYLMYGARTSVVLALCCTVLATLVSVIIGVGCAVMGGWVDLLIQRLVDSFQCIPSMLIMLILMSALGNGLWQLILVIAIPSGIGGSRMIRSAAISVRDSEYIKMSGMLGAGALWKMVRHVIPNILPIVLMNLANSLGGVIMLEASLNYMGYGVAVGTPSWGAMLTGQGRSNMYKAPWLALAPGVCIALMVFGSAMFGDGIRDLLDPRLKGGVGGYKTGKKKQKEKGKAAEKPANP